MRSALESKLAEKIGAASFADLSGVRGAEESQQNVYTIPNAITMTRIACSPAISWLILDAQYEAAALGVCLAGASDWVDGFIAKNFNQTSTLGTFIDPLADKILVGCVAVPLVMQGALPTWVVGIMVGRDALLISGVLWVRLGHQDHHSHRPTSSNGTAAIATPKSHPCPSPAPSPP